MSERQEFLSDIERLRRDPLHIQRVMVKQVEQTYDGTLQLFSNTTPFIHGLQLAATLSSGLCEEAEVRSRRQYAALAVTPEDIYHHMSDRDYVGRFAVPATAPFSILMRKDEVLARMVPTGIEGVSKLVIPSGTTIEVLNSHTFTFTHPVEIRQMAHGGITCLYDNSKPSPFHDLTSNQVSWDMTRMLVSQDARQGEDWIMIDVDLLQYKRTRRVEPISSAVNVTKRYAFTDKFFHARVWNSVGGKWIEMHTTHSEMVVDPVKPTAVLKVIDNELEVHIPQVYINTGQVTEEIAIEIFSTKGDMYLDLSTIDSTSFTFSMTNADITGLSKYTAPLSAISERICMSKGRVNGGRDTMSFLELRNNVLENAIGPQSLPITPTQLTARLRRMGYDIVTRMDLATRRVFTATRTLPPPEHTTLSTPMNIGVPRWTTSLDDLIDEPNVYRNGNSVTVTPDTLFLYENGKVNLVPHSRTEEIKLLPRDVMMNHISGSDYMYSPFYYVLDQSNGVFESRAYHFGDPKLQNVVFDQENDTLGLYATIQERDIQRTDAGWVVALRTRSSDEFKQLSLDAIVGQLSFRPKGDSSYTFVNHTSTIRDKDNEVIFTFHIETNYDVRDDHSLGITNFKLFDDSDRTQQIDLRGLFDFVIAIDATVVPFAKGSGIDKMVGNHILTGSWVGYYHESFQLNLGVSLGGLWNRSRPVVGPQSYKRYEQDVFLTYDENEYERDDNGELIWTVDTGKPTLRLIHSKGDVKLDPITNDPIVLHHAGSMYVENGAPVVLQDRDMRQEIDLVLFDGMFWFANAVTDQVYKSTVTNDIVRWITDDLNPVQEVLLDESKIYFRPKETMGNISVILGENSKTTMRANRNMKVEYYVSRAVYRDTKIREVIQKVTSVVIRDALDVPVVTYSDIVAKLRKAIGPDAIEIIVHGLDGQSVISITDDSSRLAVGKRAVSLADGTISVTEALEVVFIQHHE